MTVPPRLSPQSLARLRRSGGELSTAVVAHLEARHPWYAGLGAEERSAVALVAQAGLAHFFDWLRGGSAPNVSAEVFGAAPRELTRSISLTQTLDLIRSVVDVVENSVEALVGPDDAPLLHEAALRYSREVAFGAAHIYADAAELRGAWDARLEGLVVDAVLRGEADDAMQSRAAALGWGSTTHVAAIAATAPDPLRSKQIDPVRILDRLHRMATRKSLHILAAVQAGRVICILGETHDALRDAGRLVGEFGDGPVVVGPTVPHLFAAGRSARAALAGHAAAHAWPSCPRPVSANDLLAERALIGDVPARNALVNRIVRPLQGHPGASLLETATAYLETGRVLEATARALFVHPNTVRYRLGRIAELTGYDLTEPHEGYAVHLAVLYGRLADAGISGTASIART